MSYSYDYVMSSLVTVLGFAGSVGGLVITIERNEVHEMLLEVVFVFDNEDTISGEVAITELPGEPGTSVQWRLHATIWVSSFAEAYDVPSPGSYSLFAFGIAVASRRRRV